MATPWDGKAALIKAGMNWAREEPLEDLPDLDGESEAMDLAMAITGLDRWEAEPWADYVLEGMRTEAKARLSLAEGK